MKNSKENTILGKIFYFSLKKMVLPMIKLIWIKRVEGLENLPQTGPYIVVANHQSYFDFISLVAVVPKRLTFLAAEKFYSSKFWRPIMEYTGQIKVERDVEDKSQVLSHALDILSQKKVLALFPQGTRSRTDEIEKTYTGVAKLALAGKVPVVPVGIKGAFEVLPPEGKLKFKKIIQIKIGQPMEFSRFYNSEATPELYRQITNEVMVEVAKLAEKQYLPECN